MTTSKDRRQKRASILRRKRGVTDKDKESCLCVKDLGFFKRVVYQVGINGGGRRQLKMEIQTWKQVRL
jgi:hypothetical protein